MIEKIAKLLNQAENAGTPEEAEVFMAAAQKLGSKYSVDLAKARHMTISKEKTLPIQKTIRIGDKVQGLKTLTDLYLGVARANDIKNTIAHDGSRVYSVGFREDIEIAEAMFASLMVQMQTALNEFKEEGSWKNESVWVEGNYYEYLDYDGRVCNKYESCDSRWVESQWKPITWRTARINFQQAFADRVESRLMQAKREEETMLNEADESIEDDGPKTALVLVEKKKQVDEAFAPHLALAKGHYSGSSASHARGARDAGYSAANKASLGGSTAIGGVKGAINA